MNKREAKDYTRKYIDGFMVSNGFKEKKNGNNSLEYVRKNKNGYDGFAIGTVDYNPIQISRYSVYKYIDVLEKITEQINKSVKLSPPIDKDTLSIAFGYIGFHQIKNKGGALISTYLPQMQTEEDVKLSVDMIIDFMQKDALPLLDRFNDIREIDKVINGDDFWFDDWQREFNLGGNFTEKQFIIAKLVGGQKHLEEVIEKHKIAAKKYWAEQGKETNCPYLTNIETPTGFTINYLKNVPSLYE